MEPAGAPMTAVVFAAGTGSRLRGAGNAAHKCLVQLGGRTLLAWHTQRLAAAGIGRVVVVTGHAARAVDAEATACAAARGIVVTTVYNPHYTGGSIASLGAALPILERAGGPVLLLDADVLYAADVLSALLGSRHPSVLLVDRNFPLDDDDPVLVPMREGRPFDFCKAWRGEAAWVGESVGLFRIAAADVPALIARTRQRLAARPLTDSYDDVVRDLVVAGRFGCEDVTGIPWIEIDFPADLDRAGREVVPAIAARESADR